MPIITIYQGASGSGEELANAVAAALGYRCVGREVLVETSRIFGIPEAKLNDITEKGSPWWERLLQNLSLASKVHATILMSQNMQGAMLDVKAERGQVSVSGTLPHWISSDEVIEKIKGVPGVNRIIADLVNTPPDIA